MPWASEEDIATDARMYLDNFIRAFCTTKGNKATNTLMYFIIIYSCIRGFVVFINQSTCGLLEFVDIFF